jgi:POTRA domain, FtsQ-type
MTLRRPLRGTSSRARLSTGPTRRGPSIRRASAGFGRTRALALLVLVLSGLAIYGASASSAFGFGRLDLSGAVLTDQAALRAALGVPPGANLFGLATDGIAQRLRGLPTVTDAMVEVALPDGIRVTLVERKPIAVWQVGGQRFLVDADRLAFAPAGAVADLPVVDDRRSLSSALAVGSVLDPVDFDAATRLAALHPVDVGSSAAALHVSIDDARGFALDTGPRGWTAIFGFYTPNLRQTELVPGQVRLLRSLLAGREAKIATVILADDRNGTYTLRATP